MSRSSRVRTTAMAVLLVASLTPHLGGLPAALALGERSAPAPDVRGCPEGTEFVPAAGCSEATRDGRLTVVTGDGHRLPTHGPDVYPRPAGGLRALEELPTGSGGYVCVDTPATQEHLELVYALPTDRPDRYDTVGRDSARREFYWGADKLLSESGALGQQVRFKVACDGAGLPSVTRLPLAVTNAATTFDAVADAARAAGLTNKRYAKYVVWVDSDAFPGGLGTFTGDDRLTSDNRNVVNPFGAPAFAMTWAGGWFGGTVTGAEVMLHEIGHTLGAVNDSAANSSLAAHCVDGRDVMCYADGGPRGHEYSEVSCPDTLPFDCGNNDFFRPVAVTPADSYLGTHWNLGNPLNTFVTVQGGASRPYPVRGLTATSGYRAVTVSWGAAVDNGSPVTSYRVTGTGGLAQTVTGVTATFAGLTPGTPYTFRVTATNAVGTSDPSGPATASPREYAAPAAPTTLATSSSYTAITVRWKAPLDTGGTPLTGNTVVATPGGASVSVAGDALSAAVPGLAQGTSYTFTVRATNAQGTGPASTPSAAVALRPPTPPGAPATVTLTPHNASVGVTWTLPVTNGAPVTDYTVRADPGGHVVHSGTSRVATLTGLTNGTAYSVTVRATNSAGTGPASTARTATPRAEKPGQPTGAAARTGADVGALSAAVSWTAPPDGGVPIENYVVRVYDAGGTLVRSPSTPTAATDHVVTGLTKGATYRFRVAARNSVGLGPDSALTGAVKVPGLPGAVATPTATSADATVTARWVAPTDNGSLPITGYVVTASTGTTLTVGPTARTAVFGGLTNGTPVTVRVQATNDLGAGPLSAASAPTTPAGKPLVPTAVGAVGGSGSATVSWSLPANAGNGAPVTSLEVTPRGVTKTVRVVPCGATCPTSVVVSGLAPGTYTFVVKSVNRVGASVASVPSASVRVS